MTDPDLNNKLDRLLALLEAQLELTRQGQREERLRRAHLTEEATDLSHSEDQAGGGDESMIGDPHTPTPAPRRRPSVSFNLNEQDDVNYEKYASPTGPRYVKTKVDPYSRTRTDPYPLDQEEDTSIMMERSKPIATPFPKFNPREVEIFILEAEAWFKFSQVYEQSRMINHMGAQLEGNAQRLTEQFNPRNARMEAYNKLLALWLTSDAPGAATQHVERFRDLEGQVNLDDNELVIDLFRGSLTRSLQEKFERNPPRKRWEWYREVEEIDRQRMLLQQASARHSQANNVSSPGTRLIQSSIPVWRLAAQPYSTRSPAQPYQPSQPYPARQSTQHLPHSNNRPLPHQPTPALEGTPAPSGGSNNTCHVCNGIRHWARDCPSRRVDSLGSRPMGPKVMVVTKDPFDEATDSGDGHSGNTEPEQEDMDLRPYQQHMGSDHEDEQDDDDDEGNDSGSQILSSVSIGTYNLGVVKASVANTADYDLILGFTELRKLKPTIQWGMGQLEFKTQEQDRPPRRPPEAARAGDLSMRSPTLHGNEFVSTERILQAALEDGPIGFMLLEVSPSSLPAFGFVPTGANKGVEMEVEVDKVVTAADIPKPYQHLRDVFDEVEADKLPHHTEHDLHLELLEGGKPPQGPLYLKGPREMAELRKYLDKNLEKGFIRPSKSPARSPVCHGPECSGSRRAPVESMAVVQSPWRPWTPTDSHAREERAHMRGGPATKRTKLKEQAQPRRGQSSRSMQMVLRRRSSVEEVDTAQEAQGCQASRVARRRSSVEGVDTAQEDRSGARGPPCTVLDEEVRGSLQALVSTLDTRVDATTLITNIINLITINTHTRPWCHHNLHIDIDRAEPPLNRVSTETDLGFRRATPDTVLFVPKKDGGLRLCVDYRGLNEITVKNRAPLPLIEEQLFLLRKARIYTKLNLRAAYNLIRIAKGDEWKTAFGTQLGLYEYLVMPFGLANAPAHFQSFINDIFRDIIGVYVVVYLDDFLIFSDTEESHVKHVTEVLTCLRSNRLFAKLSKCEFHTKTVEFLGYIIKPTGIEMDPGKVRTVKEWPMLASIHDIQWFLGFANFYRRFIAHFARIAKPLTSLVKPTECFKKFELPKEAQKAFHQLIQAFTSAGVLQHFDYHHPTRLETDSSDFAIAGVLKQEHEDHWHPVAFYSRKMSSAERNYEIHDKELLAVVACLTQWRHMLAGLPSQLVILTDHEALKYFKSQRRITGQQARWAVLLADFDFILQYRPGDKGGEPDALTRRADMQPAGEEQEHNMRQLLPPRVFAETADHDSTLVAPMLSMEAIASKGLKDLVKIFQPLDQELQEIHMKKPFEVKDNLWYSGGRLVIPKVTMPGRTNNRHSRSAKEVDGQSLSVEHL
ncbi:uncharacterized protein UDID_18602 [Ustilago sp. UG-2017a]|nr:uncharacterized protein UDID_18602 [Ustilago sp. UG-2017a]